MGWRTLSIVWVVLFILLPVTAAAEVTQAVVTVEGMSCPFCAFGVEKKLKQVEGTNEVTVNMKDGTATLVAADGKSLDIDQINKAVKASGFTAGLLRITVIGAVKEGKENLLLAVRNSPLTIYLINLKPSFKQRLLAMAKSGAVAIISGTMHEHVAGLPTMVPESVLEVRP